MIDAIRFILAAAWGIATATVLWHFPWLVLVLTPPFCVFVRQWLRRLN